MKRFILTLVVMIFTATVASAFEGLTVGVNQSYGHFITEPKMTHDSFNANGVHVRYLFETVGSDILLGIEGSYQNLNGTILGRETANSLIDISGVIGYSFDRHFPHIVGGYSNLKTNLHGSDGYNIGFGVSYKISESWFVTTRATYREFDGPAQGSDLIMPTISVMFEYNF